MRYEPSEKYLFNREKGQRLTHYEWFESGYDNYIKTLNNLEF